MNGTARKSAYVGCTTAITNEAAAAEARTAGFGRRVASIASASAAGTSSWRDAVAGSARAVYAPPWAGAIATIAAPARADASAGVTRRKSAQPASKPSTTAKGASTLGSWRTTSDGSTPPTFATRARKPCQSGNA